MLRRLATTLLVTLLAVPLLSTGTALASGTGGVDISPYPGSVNGRQVTAFHVDVPESGPAIVRYSVRNTTDKVATARVFSAAAERTPSGGWSIGTATSAPFLGLRDTVVTLRPHESRITSFKALMPAHASYGAVVVEVKSGSIVQQAATIVYLRSAVEAAQGAGPAEVIVIIAAILIASAAIGVGFSRVRRRRRAATALR